MTEFVYIIDSSSLIALNKTNPMYIFPSTWKRIEGLVHQNRLLAPREVLDEITRFDDVLAEWGKGHPRIFVDPTSQQIKMVKEILNKYPSLIERGKQFSADPWVIALAVELIRNDQSTLVEVKRIVVTEEKLRGNRIRIPYVCKEYNVEAIDVLDMFRREGWVF